MTEHDEMKVLLAELRDLVPRAVVMTDGLEHIEHRVGAHIEGSRQQLGHLVSSLKIREMHAEMLFIRTAMERSANAMERIAQLLDKKLLT